MIMLANESSYKNRKREKILKNSIKLLLAFVIAFGSFSLFNTASIVKADTVNVDVEDDANVDDTGVGEPIYYKGSTIDEVQLEIEAMYNNVEVEKSNNIVLKAAKSKIWKASKKVYDNNEGYYITTYFWLTKSDMSGYNMVSRAEQSAVKKKYKKIESKYEYKMSTKQHIGYTNLQTQGYATISASAKCYSRR